MNPAGVVLLKGLEKIPFEPDAVNTDVGKRALKKATFLCQPQEGGFFHIKTNYGGF